MGIFGTHVGISRITLSEHKFRRLSELFRSLSITSRLVDASAGPAVAALWILGIGSDVPLSWSPSPCRGAGLGPGWRVSMRPPKRKSEAVLHSGCARSKDPLQVRCGLSTGGIPKPAHARQPVCTCTRSRYRRLSTGWAHGGTLDIFFHELR